MSYKRKEPKGMDTLKPYLATVRSQDSRQVNPQGETSLSVTIQFSRRADHALHLTHHPEGDP